MNKLVIFLSLIFLFSVHSKSPLQKYVKLEFREVSSEKDEEAVKVQNNDKQAPEIWLKKKVLMDEKAIKSVKLAKEDLGGFMILISLTEKGTELFAKITKNLQRKRLAIVVDGVCVSSPMIIEPIPDGKVQITGDFDKKEAQRIVDGLNGKK